MKAPEQDWNARFTIEERIRLMRAILRIDQGAAGNRLKRRAVQEDAGSHNDTEEILPECQE